jgi:hypothetical protein
MCPQGRIFGSVNKSLQTLHSLSFTGIDAEAMMQAAGGQAETQSYRLEPMTE